MSEGKERAATEALASPASGPIALVDLDGTLCDCAGALARALFEIRGPAENARDENSADPLPHIVARRRMVMSTPGFWRSLDPLPLGFQLLDVLHQQGFQTHILTKGPANQPLAWMEKFDWCRRHVPHLPVIMTEDKGLIHGEVLVDDWPAYIARWLHWRPSGLVIVPAQPWNADIAARFPVNSIRYDGTNLDDVRGRLAAIHGGANTSQN